MVVVGMGGVLGIVVKGFFFFIKWIIGGVVVVGIMVIIVVIMNVGKLVKMEVV